MERFENLDVMRPLNFPCNKQNGLGMTIFRKNADQFSKLCLLKLDLLLIIIPL